MNETNEPPQPLNLSSIATSLLKAELEGRLEDDVRPKCGSDVDLGSYNTPLHVAALVLILVLSTLACSFPIIARRFPRLPIPHRFLFLSRHFGTGVLIATAFVHLLPTAFVSLTDPCLPRFWTDGYPAMAGLVAMTSVLVVVGIEMFFAIRGAGHIHASEYGMVDQEAAGFTPDTPRPPEVRPVALRHFKSDSIGAADAFRWPPTKTTTEDDTPAPVAMTELSPPTEPESDGEMSEPESLSIRPGKSRPTEIEEDRLYVPGQGPTQNGGLGHGHHSHISSTASLSTQKLLEEQKALLQCLLLEAGILFHSVFIGMALSVATGTPFIVLLVAISFHQTFEGLALGSRIAAITSFGPQSPKPWLMALAYGTTTPIGQAIGLAVHNMYDPESQTGLLMVGMMNAISSGLLLFAGLVELLAEDFLSDNSYETLQGKRRLHACWAVVAGSLLMALVGAWA